MKLRHDIYCQLTITYFHAITLLGCEWVADNANGPSVASMSLGGGASATVDDAVQYMIDAGITVAVAAGNDDDDACDYSPARSAPVSYRQFSFSEPVCHVFR